MQAAQPRTFSASLRTAGAGAIAMALLEVITWRCLLCDPWGLVLRLGRMAAAGAIGGLVVGAAYPVVKRLGTVGQYVLGIIGAGIGNAAILYLSPFVRDSFFFWRPGYLQLVVPSLIFGTIATFELRRRHRRFQERSETDLDSTEEASPWLHSMSLARQASFAFLALLIAASGTRAWNRYLPHTTAEEFAAEMKEAVAAYPDDPAPHYYLARALMDSRAWDEALPLARRALELDGSVPAYHESVGWALIGTRQPIDALQHFKHAAALAPNDPRLWRDLGRVAYMVGNRSEALAAYQRLTELTSAHMLWPREDREAWADLQREFVR